MGRPQRVSYKALHKYDKLHTKKVKMYSGVEITALYPIKETEQYYISPEVWASGCSKFRYKKKNVTLSVDIPEITDIKTIAFLNEHAWHDWVGKERNDEKTDISETIALLDKLYPNKKKVYFYELDNLIHQYCCGTFISFDGEGNVKEEVGKNQLKTQKYYTRKYMKYVRDEDMLPHIKHAYDKYAICRDNGASDEERQKAFGVYSDLEADYFFENFNLNNEFIEIGKNAICYPVAFSNNTAEWSREKYGKLIAYAEAGEIMFVVTPDTIFFEIKRHY